MKLGQFYESAAKVEHFFGEVAETRSQMREIPARDSVMRGNLGKVASELAPFVPLGLCVRARPTRARLGDFL